MPAKPAKNNNRQADVHFKPGQPKNAAEYPDHVRNAHTDVAVEQLQKPILPKLEITVGDGVMISMRLQVVRPADVGKTVGRKMGSLPCAGKG